MRAVSFAVVACVPLLIAAAPDGPPDIDIAKICNRGSVGEKAAQDACSKDEQKAKVELADNWDKFPGDVRKSCTDTVHIGGVPSYVELLTCAQMHQWSREGAKGRDQGRAGIPPVKP